MACSIDLNINDNNDGDVSRGQSDESTGDGDILNVDDSISNGQSEDNNDGEVSTDEYPSLANDVRGNGDAARVPPQSNWAEVVKKRPAAILGAPGARRCSRPFRFLIKVPMFDELRKQVRLAKANLDDKTKARDAIQLRVEAKIAEAQIHSDRCGTAVGEHKAASNLVKSKRMEIESLQSLIKKGETATAIAHISSRVRVRNLERRIQNEALPSKERKKLIREISEQNELREKLSSTLGSEDDMDRILEQRDEEVEVRRLEILGKELDILKKKALEAQANALKLEKRYDDERKKTKELQARSRDADEVRQAAHARWQSLSNELQEKIEYFSKYRDDAIVADKYASTRDKQALHRLCTNNVEDFMKEWNASDEFRKEYIRINARTTNVDERVQMVALNHAENVISEGEKMEEVNNDDREFIDEVAKESMDEIASVGNAGEIRREEEEEEEVDIASETEPKQETSAIAEGEKTNNGRANETTDPDFDTDETKPRDEIEWIEETTRVKEEVEAELKVLVVQQQHPNEVDDDKVIGIEKQEADKSVKEAEEERDQKKREKRRRQKERKKERDAADSIAMKEKKKKKNLQFSVVIIALSVFVILLVLWLCIKYSLVI